MTAAGHATQNTTKMAAAVRFFYKLIVNIEFPYISIKNRQAIQELVVKEKIGSEFYVFKTTRTIKFA